MAITVNKQPINYLSAGQDINNTHLNDFAPLGGKHSQSQQANFDAQALQGSLITLSDAITDELYQVNATVLTVKETFELAENAVRQRSSTSDPIRAKMKAAKRDLNQIEDLVNSLKTKRNKTEVIEDARSHIGSLNGFIKNIHTGYQKTYGEVIKKATEYMQSMNTAIGTISNAIYAGKDGKIHFDSKKYLFAIDDAVGRYSGREFKGNKNNNDDLRGYFRDWKQDTQDAKTLIQIPAKEGALEFWKKKLEGQGFIVRQAGKNINIYPDLKYISEIYSVISRSSVDWSGSDIMAQEFQSLQTAIDSQKSAINSGVSRLLETFRQDNSHFDTLVQLLIQLIKDLNQYNNGLMNI